MRRVLLLLFASALVAATSLRAQTSTPPPAPAAATDGKTEPDYHADPKFQKTVSQAKERTRNLAERRSLWQKADKIAGGRCMECLREVIAVDARFNDWKDMARCAGRLDELAVLPKDKVYAQFERGTALMHMNGEKPHPDQLEQADAAFRSVLALGPHLSTVEYQDGRVLALLGRFDDARQMFSAFLRDAKPTDTLRTRAEHFVADPHLASLPMAPPFTVRTLQGEEFSLDDMQGKVVLLDFWASWCGPCRQTLPEVKHVVEKFAGQPLVVVSISIDHDEQAWKQAVQKNGMTWPQYLDADGSLSAAYEASSIPRFFTIDSDGALQAVQVGSDADVEGHVRKLLAKAAAAQRHQATASDKGAAE